MGRIDRRNGFIINLHESNVASLGFKLVTPGSTVTVVAATRAQLFKANDIVS